MSINYRELPQVKAKVDFKEPTSERVYVFDGDLDKLNIQLAAGIVVPQYDTGINATGQTIPLFLMNLDVQEESGGGVWKVTARYEASNDTVDIAFTVGTAGTKVFQALETIAVFDCIDGSVNTSGGGGANVPDFGGAIGVNGDDVEGVEIEVGKVEFTVTKKWKFGDLASGYLQDLMNMTDRSAVNDNDFALSWKGQSLIFPKGTLRFRSAQVNWGSGTELSIAYHFAYQRSITEDDAFTIGGSATITKEGWHYGWIWYKTVVPSGSGQITKKPYGFVVNRVYPYWDFDELDLN